MYLQVNDIESGERCTWNATCKRKFRINKKQQQQQLGYPSFEVQNNPIFASGLIFMHVQEKIKILPSVSSNYFLLYFDICLNIQRFVYSEVC